MQRLYNQRPDNQCLNVSTRAISGLDDYDPVQVVRHYHKRVGPAFAEWFGISSQNLRATLPIFDNRMRLSTILPKKHSRPRVQTVMKYQPSAV